MSDFDQYENENIKVTLLHTGDTIEVKPGLSSLDFLDKDENIVAVLSTNELLSLQEPIDIQTTIQPVYKTDKEAIPMLTETLAFLVQAAACHCFPGLTLELRYTIQRGLFFQYPDMCATTADIMMIQKEIDRLVELNLPLKRAVMSHYDALKTLEDIRHMKAHTLVKTLNNPRESMIEMRAPEYTFHLLWRNPVLSHTGVCKGLFRLIPYNNGFIVRHSEDFKTLDMSPIRGSERLQRELCQIMDDYLEQARAIGMSSIAAVNQLVLTPKKLAEVISYAEFNHERQLSQISARCTEKTKIIFVAGPSSSNKTTTANRISCHLRSRGFEPIRVSLDDFYGWPDSAPRVPGTNKPDFEHLEALDLPRIKSCLTGLLAGEEVVMAHYDFKKQVPGDGRRLTLPPKGVLVVEGIHALNDEITQVVPAEQRLRVFIQPIGALPWDETRVIDFISSRLLRRMCRDYLFRGRTADQTIDSWADVRAGEERWILPNQTKADVYFNSSIFYEQFVNRVYAVPLLQQVPQSSKNYGLARTILRMLAPLQPVPVNLVPEMSLLYEFLPGGSQYEDFFF